jgi:hypothetical protein
MRLMGDESQYYDLYFKKELCFFQYISFFSIRQEATMMGLVYSGSCQKCAPDGI